MTDPRTPGRRVVRPDTDPRRPRDRADSTAVRMVLGLAGLASASALSSAMLPSILPHQAATASGVDTAAADPTQQPQPSVIHVTHVVTLGPGQTLPPDAGVNLAPAPAPRATPRPTPRVVIQTITRQSGTP